MAARARGRTHSVLGIVPLLDLATARGLDVRRLLRDTGIAEGLLTDPSSRIPFTKELLLVGAMIDRTKDAALGLDAGRQYHLATFGLLGAAATAATTPRDVLRLFLEHVDLTYTPFAVTLDEAGGEGKLSFLDHLDLGRLHRFYVDRELTFVSETVRALRPDLHGALLRRIDYDYAEPEEAARYRKVSPCPVRFGARVAAVVLDVRLGESTTALRGSALGMQVLEAQLPKARRGRGQKSLSERVRRAVSVAVTMRSTLPSEQDVAAELGIPTRTLRRHLAEEGETFRALADDVLAKIACRHLEDGRLSVGELAERLGYADATAFVRAFRRWTGETPRRYASRTRAPAK